jgi:glycosyltransferase involved in cell wall biosynthesis
VTTSTVDLESRERGAAPELSELRIAVLVPCYNEEAAIAAVVADFRRALPGATVYVYDNNSRDMTSEKAMLAGAVARREPLQGKGHVVRRMFSDVEADVYVLVDGDSTYHAPSAPEMVRLLMRDRLDMVVGTRVEQSGEAYRSGHRWGNAALTGFVALLFGNRFTDMLSGYRVFSRRYIKSFPALSTGFEIETELTVHALQLTMPVAELATPYGARPKGSVSKLSTYRDGFRIGMTILRLFAQERPFRFFSIGAAVLAFVAVVLAIPLVITYLQSGLVPRFPTAILATGIMILAVISLFSGMILQNVAVGRREMKRLAYLAIPAAGETR